MSVKSFHFFENMRDVILTYPIERQLEIAFAIIDYGLDKIEPKTIEIKALIQALKPSLDKQRTRGGARPNAGAPAGNSNAKKDKLEDEQLPNNPDSLTGLPNWIQDILTGKESPPEEWDLTSDKQEIYRKINPYINSYITNPNCDKNQMIANIYNKLRGLKAPPAPPPPYVKPGKKINTDCCKNEEEIALLKEWLQYKKDKRQPYCDQQSVNLFMQQLRKLGDNDINKMQEVIINARRNNYNGIVAIDKNKNKRSNERPPL